MILHPQNLRLVCSAAGQPRSGIHGDRPITADLDRELIKVAAGRATHIIAVAIEGRAMTGTDEAVFRLDERDQAAEMRTHLVNSNNVLAGWRIGVLLCSGVIGHLLDVELAVRVELRRLLKRIAGSRL